MVTLGYFAAILVGISLGLLGGGGSILTVPILVYLVGLEPKRAIPISLLIVGLGALTGALRHYKGGNVQLKPALYFLPSAMIGAWMGAKGASYLSGLTQMILFGVMTVLAAAAMIRPAPEREGPAIIKPISLSLSALGVGVLTGIIGVGGGFMIVPALVFFAGMSIRYAIGTSLVVIALNSFAGFIGYLGTVQIPWDFTLIFAFFVSIGILVGVKIAERMQPASLKKSFAGMLFVVGGFVLAKNFALI